MLNDDPFDDYNIKLVNVTDTEEFEANEEGPVVVIKESEDVLKIKKVVYKDVNGKLRI